jgi:hypothetical protein
MRRWLGLFPVVLAACGGSSPVTGEAGTQGDGTGSTGAPTTAPSGEGGTATGNGTAGVDATSADPTAGTTGDPDGGSGRDTDAAFVHVFSTELTMDGRLALRSNLPPQSDDCLAREPTAPCDDDDGDGLVDAWEDVAFERLRPQRRFDEAESLVDDATAVLADVGRVAPGPTTGVHVYVMLGYSRDYGSCGGISGHNGDSERVAIDLAAWPEGGAGGVVVLQAYTAAHEGTATDHGRVFAGGDLGELVFAPDPDTGEPRWVVFPSADKHATYATLEICEGISFVPCFDEDCGPDGVADPSRFDALPPGDNAGELEAPRLTDLAVLGFPGEDAWAEQDFCGGLGGTGCSSPVRDKLLVDPFG